MGGRLFLLPLSLLVLGALAAVGCAADDSAPASLMMSGVVVDGYTEGPVAYAEVAVAGRQTSTDAAGRFAVEMPSGNYEVLVRADGYIDGRRVNVQSNGSDAELRIFPLRASDEVIRRWQQRRLPRPALDEFAFPNAGVGFASLPLIDDEVELPATIRVWRARGTNVAPSSSNGYADRSCEGDVETLDLEEYIRGVLPHEWGPSWHEESLKAGSVAARSFAVAWTLRGGRWACADVDDGTVTQVYDDNRAASTDSAIEATRGQVIVRDGEIVLSEFSAENAHPTAGHNIDDPVCAGATRRGHGRGMCQEGTQRWATATCFEGPCDFGVHGSEPKDYEWMVKHYYPGADIAGGTPAAPCDWLSAAGGVIDEEGPCFSHYGPSSYWREETVGFEDHLFWTNAFVTDSPSNWAEWQIVPTEAGRYRLEAFVDPSIGRFVATRYEIVHSDTESTVLVDQSAADGWAILGDFDFAEGEGQSLRVFDNYESVAGELTIAADAIRLTRLDGVGLGDGGLVGTRDAGVDPDSAMTNGDGGPFGRRASASGGCATSAESRPPYGSLIALAFIVLYGRRR